MALEVGVVGGTGILALQALVPGPPFGSIGAPAGDDGTVIVAVEGPSAAGKTTWCSRRNWPVVAEYRSTGREPDGSDPDRQGDFWVEVDAGRWREAVALEQGSEVVLCDSDPLKLHYSWCLARVGAAPWSRFEHQLRVVRAAFAAGRLGLADLVLVSVPAPEVLRAQKAGDPTRRRGAFELHVALCEPLREWYSAVEAADPGRVVWSFPTPGVPTSAGVRPRRSDVALLDRLLENLPTPGGPAGLMPVHRRSTHTAPRRISGGAAP